MIAHFGHAEFINAGLGYDVEVFGGSGGRVIQSGLIWWD